MLILFCHFHKLYQMAQILYQHTHLQIHQRTPYCKPKDIAIAKLFIKAFTNSPSLLVSIKISPIFPSSYSPVCKYTYDLQLLLFGCNLFAYQAY